MKKAKHARKIRRPRDLQKLHKQAASLVRNGRDHEAAAIFSRLRVSDPSDAQARFMLGVLCGRMGDFAQSVNYFQEVLDLSPQAFTALCGLGVVQKMLKRYQEAEISLEKALQLRPDLLEAHMELANLFQEQGKWAAAEKAFTAALRCNPSAPQAQFNLGKVLLERGFTDKACHHLELAAGVEPLNGDIFLEWAHALLRLGKNEEARQYFEKARGLLPENFIITAKIARIYGREKDISDAYETLNRELEKTPEDVVLILVFAELCEKFNERDRGVELLEQAKLQGRHTPEQIQRIHYALGSLYDKKENYDCAFYNFKKANEYSVRGHDDKEEETRFQAIKEVFSHESIGSLPRSNETSQAPVFIVGMPRSGTSLLEQMLSMHPDVVAAGELMEIPNIPAQLAAKSGAPRGYPYCLMQTDPTVLSGFAQEYLKKLEGFSRGQRYVIDKMPHNFLHLGLISLLFPKARVINCLRNPLDTCISIYFQNLHPDHTYATDLLSIATHYRRYLDLMTHWHAVTNFPVIDVVYEELVDKPDEILARVLGFLNLPWNEQCLEFSKSERVVITASVDQVRKPIYSSSVGRWQHYEKYLQEVQKELQGLDYEVGIGND